MYNNGLLQNPEGLLLYRKALGHSNEFDCSIIYNTSQSILDPLGRPVRRTQIPEHVKNVWNRMNQVIIAYMLERYPDPDQTLVLAGEASLDATWPLTSPGVPSIRMLHNHFIVFNKDTLRTAPLADNHNPNLTDGGQNSLFQSYMRDVYRDFFDELDLQILRPCQDGSCKIALTGYPQGLPSWEVQGGVEALKEVRFWKEYDTILKGFIDFYRTFFTQVSTRNAALARDIYFPELVEAKLQFNNDFLKTAPDGRGVINILAAEKLMNNPRLYATCLLWMLSELFEKLPEVGDLDKPKLVFLFDEAHLLFNDAPKAVLDQIERVTRLIRSKGVGVYYVTQSPGDVPDRISAQLGNRIQHALRAFTPKEQKAIKAAATTFVKNPEINTEQAIQQLRVGEALVSTLRNKGEPSIVQRTLIRPPMARVGPITPAERTALVALDTANGVKYGTEVVTTGAFERVLALNSISGKVTDTIETAKEKAGGWFGIGRKDR